MTRGFAKSSPGDPSQKSNYVCVNLYHITRYLMSFGLAWRYDITQHNMIEAIDDYKLRPQE
jgi:hypothetical protein